MVKCGHSRQCKNPAYPVIPVQKKPVTLDYCFTKFRETELMQYRSPVGAGPSANTCPW